MVIKLESWKDKYTQKDPVATYGFGNGYPVVLDFEYGIDDYAVIKDYSGTISKCKVNHTFSGKSYINHSGKRLYLDDFMRI